MFWKWKYKYFFLLFILKLFSLVECSLKNECIVLCFFFFLVHAKCHMYLLYNPQYLSFCPGTFVRTKQADAVIHKFVWDYHHASSIKLVCAAAETHGCSNMVDLWTVFTVPEHKYPQHINMAAASSSYIHISMFQSISWCYPPTCNTFLLFHASTLPFLPLHALTRSCFF